MKRLIVVCCDKCEEALTPPISQSKAARIFAAFRAVRTRRATRKRSSNPKKVRK